MKSASEEELQQGYPAPWYEIPPGIFAKLKSKCVEKIYAPGDKILEQGALNFLLFFLKSGVVSVFVDGRKITEVDKPGDVLGEMSVLSRSPCSATLVAKSTVTVWELPTKDVLPSFGGDTLAYESWIFKTYSQSLINKLKVTNDKAKYYEDLVEELKQSEVKLQQIQLELEKAQRAAMISGSQTRKENALLYLQLETLRAENEIEKEHNHQLIESHVHALRTLKDWRSEEASLNCSSPFHQKIEHLEKTLRSASQSNLHKITQPLSVLFFEKNRKDQVLARMALGSTGVDLEIASSASELGQRLQEKKYQLVMVPIEFVLQLQPHLKDLGSAELGILSQSGIQDVIGVLKQLGRDHHLVTVDRNDRDFSIRNIFTTVAKIAEQNFFGLEKYLHWGVEVKEFKLTHSKERAPLIGEMLEYFSSLGVRPSNCDRSASVAEELLMNAVYDAPVDANGKPLFNHLPRTTAVHLDPDQQARFRFACDGITMAISCEDPFGSLRVATLYSFLDQCYSGRAADPAMAARRGGAGRGLHQIVENSDSAVFNILRGTRTEVIALLNVDPKRAGVRGPCVQLFIR